MSRKAPSCSKCSDISFQHASSPCPHMKTSTKPKLFLGCYRIRSSTAHGKSTLQEFRVFLVINNQVLGARAQVRICEFGSCVYTQVIYKLQIKHTQLDDCAQKSSVTIAEEKQIKKRIHLQKLTPPDYVLFRIDSHYLSVKIA